MNTVPEGLAAALTDRYRIERELGAGGMATVYLAEDLKHHRQVAVKVLRPELSMLLGADRFLKEIELTANLQHPHLLPLFDSGEAAGQLYYVMPYVAGESLRDRLKRERQLGIEEAVRIATQAASALDYAHRQGVIHRDIKPENILLHDGQAVIADFGIALAVREAGGNRLTETGLSLGTPQYMSPEQATGERALDARSDIYSLACVLYEMLVGEPPHTGPSMQAVIARVVAEEPRGISGQRRAVPWHVEAAVMQALEKLPADRFATAGEFAAALATPLTRETSTRWRRPATRRSMAVRAVAGVVLLGVGVVAGVVGARRVRRATGAADEVVRRLTINLPDSIPMAFLGVASDRVGLRSLALSPDGRTLVYVGLYQGRTYLFVRPLDDERVRRLEGTEGASGPFFAPNGRWIAFFANKTLKKVALEGGQPVDLAGADAYGGVWLGDGRIVFSRTNALEPSSVDENGGAITPITLARSGGRLIWSAAWDLDHVAASGDLSMWMLSLSDSGRSAFILGAQGFVRPRSDIPLGPQLVPGPNGSPQFLTPDLLLVAGDGRLQAVPFGPRARGTIVALDETLRQENWGWNAQFTTSAEGTLVYAPGGSVERGVLVVADRRGGLDTLPFAPAMYGNPSYSPDGSRVAVTVQVPQGWELQVLHLPSATRVVALSSGRVLFGPVWSADGTHIAVYTDSSSISFEVRASDGALRKLPEHGSLNSLSADGTWAGWQLDSGAYIVGPSGARSTAGNIFYFGGFSRDGKWVTGRAGGPAKGPTSGTFVSAVPLGGPLFVVNSGFCEDPNLMPDGREVICRGEDAFLYSVPLVFEGGEVRGLPPRRLTNVPLLPRMGSSWSLSPDGQRMLFVVSSSVDTTTRLTVVTNYPRVVDAKLAEVQGQARRP